MSIEINVILFIMMAAIIGLIILQTISYKRIDNIEKMNMVKKGEINDLTDMKPLMAVYDQATLDKYLKFQRSLRDEEILSEKELDTLLENITSIPEDDDMPESHKTAMEQIENSIKNRPKNTLLELFVDGKIVYQKILFENEI